MKNSAGFSLGNIRKIMLAERKNKREKKSFPRAADSSRIESGKNKKNQGSPMKKQRGKQSFLFDENS